MSSVSSRYRKKSSTTVWIVLGFIGLIALAIAGAFAVTAFSVSAGSIPNADLKKPVSLPADGNPEEQYRQLLIAIIAKRGYVDVSQSYRIIEYIFQGQARDRAGNSKFLYAEATWQTWSDHREWTVHKIVIDGKEIR